MYGSLLYRIWRFLPKSQINEINIYLSIEKNRQKASENFFVFTEAFFISSSARSLCHLANKSRYFQIVNILKYFLLKLVFSVDEF